MTTSAWIQNNKEKLIDISRYIWENPELALNEKKAAALMMQVLRDEGFEIRENLGGMETAFSATWGSGKPVIAYLGEYDALSDLSQAVCGEKKAITPGAPGHGCGHNQLGTAALGSALALKHYMQEHGTSGTVVFYGCPAEETMTGKILMAADGAFEGLDTVITWHPWQGNQVVGQNFLAMNTAKFNFYGVSSHAAASPDQGRSALDAAELMNVGVNFLREHVTTDVRIHYSFSNPGGQPNQVQPYAQTWYYVRAQKRPTVDDVFDRICNIARGAALMTDTKVEIELLTGCWDILPNRVLEELMDDCLREVQMPQWSEEDWAFAREVMGETARLYEGVRPLNECYGQMFGSTDVADVSWIAPTVQIGTATAAVGTPMHTWQFTAFAGHSIGMKSMLAAAEAMALAGVKLMEDPQLVAKAKETFLRNKGDFVYRTVRPAKFN